MNESIKEIVTILLSVLAAVGGLEGIKWWWTRHSSRRLAKASADSAEAKADSDEFGVWREQVKTLQGIIQFQVEHIKDLNEQIKAKEERAAERSGVIRKLNSDMIQLAKDKAESEAVLNNQIAKMAIERALKLCEVKGCPKREPQSGY